jgi:deazaflavin-dependent oxidoreductase (nitroreductase family)
MDNPVEFNAEIVAEFRARGGHVSGVFADTPLILVHHVGARSGITRVVPLAYLPHSNGGFVIVASAGGSPTQPAWYHNLRAHPEIIVEVGPETFRVVAEELDAQARCALWPMLVERAPAVGEFQSMTTRTIPVFVLTREC